MAISEEMKNFKEAARPLIEWLNNFHPHHVIIVEHDGAQLFEGNMSIKCDDYIRD